MYKLLALDLDDTLLGPDGTIGEPERAALAGAMARGCGVTLVTARSWRGTQPFVAELGLTLPVICMTGAVVHTPQGEPVGLTGIPNEQARGLAALADAGAWSVRLYFPDGQVHASRRAEDFTPRPPAAVYPTDAFVGKVAPYLETGEDPLQVVALGHRSVEAAIAALASFPELVATVYDRGTSTSRTHIMHRNANKGAALARFCLERGIPREAVIAMGDGETDQSMIEWAGLGVAMGWAPEGVRRAADLVTGRDDPHPVATVIRKVFGEVQGQKSR